jgi:tetratricopeptide (TPR) repeat protein
VLAIVAATSAVGLPAVAQEGSASATTPTNTSANTGTATSSHKLSAQESADYRAAIRAALIEYGAGRFPEARALFLRAHSLQPSARTLRGLGMVEFELRHYVEAIRLTEQAVRDTRNPLDAVQRKEAAGLLDQAGSFVGRYHVACTPETAQLYVDGQAYTLDGDHVVVLDVGEHTLSAEAPGYTSQQRQFDVHGGEQAEVQLTLATEVSEQAAAPAAIAASAMRATEPTPTVLTQSDRGATDAKPVTERWWFWTGLGAAVLGGTAIALAVALSDHGAGQQPLYHGNLDPVRGP